MAGNPSASPVKNVAAVNMPAVDCGLHEVTACLREVMKAMGIQCECVGLGFAGRPATRCRVAAGPERTSGDQCSGRAGFGVRTHAYDSFNENDLQYQTAARV